MKSAEQIVTVRFRMRRAEIDLRRLTDAFAGDGLHGVGMVEVARAAGVAKPTLYRAHPSKDALFLACVNAEVERLLDRLYAAYARALDDTLADALAAIASALLAYADERPPAFRLLFVTAPHQASTVAADVDGALARVIDRLADLLVRHPAWHASAADAALVAGLLPAAVACELRHTEGPWNQEAAAARIGALLQPPPAKGSLRV